MGESRSARATSSGAGTEPPRYSRLRDSRGQSAKEDALARELYARATRQCAQCLLHERVCAYVIQAMLFQLRPNKPLHLTAARLFGPALAAPRAPRTSSAALLACGGSRTGERQCRWADRRSAPIDKPKHGESRRIFAKSFSRIIFTKVHFAEAAYARRLVSNAFRGVTHARAVVRRRVISSWRRLPTSSAEIR